MRNPVLILDAFYILPSKLLDHCMKVLLLGTRGRTPCLLMLRRTRQSHPVELSRWIQLRT
ncbi:hypothetical protein JG687_00011318 [Phytophthora cactorum]|uniref:Uncharacterized protein n=1 Tax=Phytophthora cactorum TaxID=29920 RepID=A0A8T1U8T0_9STRA|nr:hypothetical protein JG687_00011318 [Phytophthora cactorum]